MRASGQWLCALDDRIMDHLAATARTSPAAMAAELVELLSTRQMPLEREEQTTTAVREVNVPRH